MTIMTMLLTITVTITSARSDNDYNGGNSTNVMHFLTEHYALSLHCGRPPSLRRRSRDDGLRYVKPPPA